MRLMRHKYLLRRCCILAALALLTTPLLSQSNKESKVITGEKGFYPLYNYSTKTYSAAPQNWAIIQDKRGVLYVANNEGILEYDGVSWRLIKVPNETNVRSLAIDKSGKIYVGASGEFGYLEPDINGNMHYVSLLSYLDKNDKDFADVYNTLVTNEGVYFQTINKIFRWNGEKIKVWNAEPEKIFHCIFYVNGNLFARVRGVGLMQFINDNLKIIKGGEIFSDESVYSMIPFKKTPPEDMLLLTKKKGLFLMKPAPKENSSDEPEFLLENFKTQIDPFLLENTSYNLISANFFYSIATVTKGIAEIDEYGLLKGFLNKEIGLQDETVYSQYSDASNNLWLATDNGISKVNITSPITSFSHKNGLDGTVQSLVRHNNILFAATNIGVFALHPGYITNGSSFSYASFEKLRSTDEPCWDLLSFRSGKYSTLLGVASENIFAIDDQLNKKEILNCRPWMIYQSKFDPSRVFIGLENGIASIYWDGSKWLEEANIQELKEGVYSITEDNNGALWLGQQANGVTRIKFKNNNRKARRTQDEITATISRFDTSSGLPDGVVGVENVNGKILFGTENGIYVFTTGNRFIQDASFASIFTDKSRQIYHIAYDTASKNIWLETYLNDKHKFEFGFLKKEGNNYLWNITPFLPYSDEIVHTVFHDDSITWFGGAGGLYRYDPKINNKDTIPYNTIIRKITIGKDSTIFNGTFFDSSKVSSLIQNQSLIPDLRFINNSIIFEFSSLNLTNENADLYKYYLEGFNTDWTNWKHETKAVYTNLPEGKYFFHVKAKNIFNQESQEAVYEFTVLPPWYRTWWAYICYVILSGGFVVGVVTISTRGLKAIIRERTAEIVEQKEQIEYKNRNITDSINYAKRIQEAILPSFDLIRKRFPENFIVYKPKDIVAGDFYWFSEKDKKFLIAACDCTGHGVPGAFMSLIGYSLLNEVILEKSITEPAFALDVMKKGIIKSLGQKGQEGEQKDGMDMSLISLEVILENNKAIHKLCYAGANNALYIVRRGQLIELNADKMPIGIYLGIDRPFSKKEMLLEQGDTIYLFTDGYADQFGGEQGKKFTKKRFKDMLLKMQDEDLAAQKNILEKTLNDWSGTQQQVDDILVMGIRIV